MKKIFTLCLSTISCFFINAYADNLNFASFGDCENALDSGSNNYMSRAEDAGIQAGMTTPQGKAYLNMAEYFQRTATATATENNCQNNQCYTLMTASCALLISNSSAVDLWGKYVVPALSIEVNDLNAGTSDTTLPSKANYCIKCGPYKQGGTPDYNNCKLVLNDPACPIS
ncbi:MAG: hypothetical protein K0S08_382 [Gammaproteobacteria bacterium]|jgi:hypothetical protein|nr:hypothetical protein [Gammaproteobacteria bacterium]